MLEQIIENGILYAIILRREFQDSDIQFFTPPEFSQQLGYMNRPKGYQVQPHYHEIQIREIQLTQEVLLVRKGLVKVTFYTESGITVSTTIIRTGDVLMLVQGGHGFEMLEDSEIIEVKQGPYLGDRDKKLIQ